MKVCNSNILQWRLSLTAISIVICMTTIDISIVNTALPVITSQLNVDASSAVWIINSYQMVMISLLLPFAILGEFIGYKKIYLMGLMIFTLSSLFCGLADSLSLLIVFRALQGLGAAAIMSVNTALIRLIYPANKLGQGLGFNALIVAISFTIAPLLSSLILSLADWEWLFLINVPIGCLATLLSWFYLTPDSNKISSIAQYDCWSALLCFIMFFTFIFGLGELTRNGSWAIVIITWSLSILSGIFLVHKEIKGTSLILAIDLFKSSTLLLSALTSICTYTVQGIAFVALPFLFLTVFQKSQFETGLYITPWAVMVALVAPIAGRLSDQYKNEVIISVGILLLMLGMLSLTLLPMAPSSFEIMIRMALCGIGFGLFQTPNLRTIMGTVPLSRSGSASGIVAISRLLGQTLGASLVAWCLSFSHAEGALSALWLGSGISFLGLIVCSIRWFQDETYNTLKQP